MKYTFIKLKTVILGHPVDRILRLATDSDGVVLDVFWRRRIEDSKTDGCLEILKSKPKKGFLNA